MCVAEQESELIADLSVQERFLKRKISSIDAENEFKNEFYSKQDTTRELTSFES